jgi:hypothetical protein
MKQVRQLTKHQEHVIKHVLGCQILGSYAQANHLHFLLDIPYLWSIDADGSMALVQVEEAIAALDVSEDIRQALFEEASTLHKQGATAITRHFKPLPHPMDVIDDVTLYTVGDTTHLEIVGGTTTLTAAWCGTSIRLLT